MSRGDRFGLYVHLPFCPQRCPYCAFAVVTGRQEDAQAYVDAVCAELETWAQLADRGGFDTVFFGGGTPTRLAPAQLATILDTAARHLGLRPGAEVTVEANPTTADAGRFADLRAAGVTRLSLGVQALRDTSLRLLGRMHDAATAATAFRRARAAGFDSVSLDLIFSIPGAPADDWPATLAAAVELDPDHLSAYALSVEGDTPFARRREAGDLPEVSQEDDADAWEHLVATLGAAGYEHYEISNFARPSTDARPGHRCRHNWDCWTGGQYLGVGLSAHSFLDGRRFWNTSDLDDYLQRLGDGASPEAGNETLAPAAARREALWLQLRTVGGACLGAPEWARLRAADLWTRLHAAGDARQVDDRLALTEAGFARADAIAVAVADLVAPDDLATADGGNGDAVAAVGEVRRPEVAA